MGHEACVLRDALASGLGLEPVALSPVPVLGPIGVAEASLLKDRPDAVFLDLRTSMEYRKAHIAGARWAIRPSLTEALRDAKGPVVIVADDAAAAGLAVETEWPAHLERPRLLDGGMNAWREAGFPVEATPDLPRDADCIDFLFFVHDRHDGNKEAASRYLAWETGLVAQLDAQELAAFRLPPARDALGE